MNRLFYFLINESTEYQLEYPNKLASVYSSEAYAQIIRLELDRLA